jgi:uncharacterized protein with PIN domain
MTALKFFLDEDIYGAVAPALRIAGVDAISTPEMKRLGESDDAQLEWASGEGRALVTFNVAHFAKLYAQWAQSTRDHAGIVVSSQRPVGDLIRRLNHLARTLDAQSMRNRLEFLGEW